MRLTTSVLIIALVASASAQQKPAEQPVTVKSGNVTLSPAKPAAAQTKPATASSKPAAAAVKPAAVPVKAAPAPLAKAPAKAAPASAAKAPAVTAKTVPAAAPAPKPVAKKVHPKSSVKPAPKVEAKATEKPAEKPANAETEPVKKVASVDHSKRDPFQTIIRDRAAAGGCVGGGKQCLIPDELALKGIVRSNGAIIAVVTTKENRAYFLRENDPVLNGVVTRITEGSITFREKTTDIFGKQSMREVVKKINPTVV